MPTQTGDLIADPSIFIQHRLRRRSFVACKCKYQLRLGAKIVQRLRACRHVRTRKVPGASFELPKLGRNIGEGGVTRPLQNVTTIRPGVSGETRWSKCRDSQQALIDQELEVFDCTIMLKPMLSH